MLSPALDITFNSWAITFDIAYALNVSPIRYNVITYHKLPRDRKYGMELERLAVIPGNVPPSHDFPAGCRFADRCEFAGKRCIKEQPDLLDMAPGHKVRCHRFTEKGVTIDE